MPTSERDYWLLCFNCGEVTPESAWTYWKADDETGDLVPAEDGYMDPTTRCPACRWDHTDDDGNPGIQDGTRAEVEAERERAAPDWADHWAEAVR